MRSVQDSSGSEVQEHPATGCVKMTLQLTSVGLGSSSF